jgi:DNA-binding SARP family transcriptional activator
VSTAVHPAAPAPGAAPASPALAVGCLGRLRISADGAQLPWRPVRRGRAVFQYLLAHRRRSVARDELAEVFWPGSSAAAARNCLNTSLSILRSGLRDVLGDLPVVVHRDGAYCLDPDLDLRVDAEELESLAAEGARRRRAGDVEGAARAFRDAADLYRGDLFEDDPYEEWMTVQRRYLRETYLTTLGDLADCESALGDPSAAIGLCRQALLAEPEREDVHRRLMEAYARVGQRAQALRQFDLCADALRRRLRAEPSHETVALCARIRRGGG